MSIKAYLFDAQGVDHEVTLADVAAENIGEKQILWVDVTDPGEQDLGQVATSLKIEGDVLRMALAASDGPRIMTQGDHVYIRVIAPMVDGIHFRGRILSLIAGPNYVVALHSGAIGFLERFDEQTRGDTQLGEFDSGTFLVALLDRFITSYFEVLDMLADKVDHLDENALKNRRDRDLLNDIVQLRNQVTELRRMLTPHRQVFATLASPDFDKVAFPGSTPDFGSLRDKLEKALDGVENARDMVIGSFDVFTSVMAQSTNDTVRVLTIITVVIGLSGVIAGVMGMNFTDWEFFHTGVIGFMLVVAAIIVLATVTLLLAKWRRLY